MSDRITNAGICPCGAATSDPEGLCQCPGCKVFFCGACEEVHQCADQAGGGAADLGGIPWWRKRSGRATPKPIKRKARSGGNVLRRGKR